MHKDVGAGEFLLDYLLADARRHRDGGDARSAYDGVDLAAGHDLHDLSEDYSARGAEYEGYEPKADYLDCRDCQEGLGLHGRADGDAEEYRGRVENFVLRREREAVGAAAFAEQVPEHEHSDERYGGRKDEAARYRGYDREEYFLSARYGAKLLHLYAAVFLRREKLDDRRLDERDERHVAVRRDGDCREYVARELRAEVDGGRAVGSADDAYARGLLDGEAHAHGPDDGDEYAELRGGSEQEGYRVGEQRAEVGERPYTHEYDDGIDFMVYSELHEVEESARVDYAGERQVDEQASEGYRHKEQRLESFSDGEIEQYEGHEEHDERGPVERDEAGLLDNAFQRCQVEFHKKFSSPGKNFRTLFCCQSLSFAAY